MLCCLSWNLSGKQWSQSCNLARGHRVAGYGQRGDMVMGRLLFVVCLAMLLLLPAVAMGYLHPKNGEQKVAHEHVAQVQSVMATLAQN